MNASLPASPAPHRGIGDVPMVAFPVAPGLTDNDIELSSRQVRGMFGNVSDMTLWRWMDSRGFPRPRKRSGRNFWVLGEVKDWRRQQDQEAADAKAA
jgi:predicted DNA-binding transcriptional regulator AlpA